MAVKYSPVGITRRWPLMEWGNPPMSRMVFVLAAVGSMTACAPGTQERTQREIHDSTRKITNEIPARAAIILEQADQFELLSLSPRRQANAAKGEFHGFRVLGAAVIKDAETRKKLVLAFEAAVAENEGIMAACFNPRHGIRVTRNKKQADFLICFECAQVQLFGDVRGSFLITSSAEALFDSVLQSSGIPRPERVLKETDAQGRTWYDRETVFTVIRF
jgi:hypothetical protein